MDEVIESDDKYYVFWFIDIDRKTKGFGLVEKEHQKVLYGVRKIAELSGITSLTKTISPHCFRHTFAHVLHEKGFSLTEIKKLMRHTDISTTTRYLDVEREIVRQKFDDVFNT